MLVRPASKEVESSHDLTSAVLQHKALLFFVVCFVFLEKVGFEGADEGQDKKDGEKIEREGKAN